MVTDKGLELVAGQYPVGSELRDLVFLLVAQTARGHCATFDTGMRGLQQNGLRYPR
jgi:hypothetical protein